MFWNKSKISFFIKGPNYVMKKCFNVSKSIESSYYNHQSITQECRNKLIKNLFKREIQTSQFRLESELALLRKKTGYAFALCRKALEMHDKDLVKAEKWLRAEAMKQGWEKAQKVKSRPTSEGLIGIYTTKENNLSSMIEVRCETDFVARNSNFVDLVSQLAERFASETSLSFGDSLLGDSSNSIKSLCITDQNKLSDIGGQLMTDTISKLGENIRFIRGCIVKINNPTENITLIPYTHAVAGKIESKNDQILLGKYGTIVALVQSSEDVSKPLETNIVEELDELTTANTIEEIGSKVGQHIIGLSPTTVTENINESSDESNDLVGNEEPTALVKQKFIFNDEITVEEFLKKTRTQVLDFVRFECGENEMSN